MEDDIGLKQPVLEVLGRVLSIEDRGLAVLAFKQMGRQIAAQEPPSAGDENSGHASTALPFSGILHTLQFQQQVHHRIHVQQLRVVGIVVDGFGDLGFPLLKKLE